MSGLVVRVSVLFAFCGTLIHITMMGQGECSLFRMQPSNATVKYGEIVQFECQVHMDYGRTLYLYFGTTLVHPLVEGRFSDLDQRVFSVDVSQCTSCLPNQTIARVWIVMNSKTLESVNFRPFRCRVHYNRTFEDSSLAFIEVIYPECTFSPPQPNKLLVTSTYVPSATSTFVPLVTSTYVPPVTSTFVPLVLNHPCIGVELNSSGNIKTNRLVITIICAVLATVLLILLVVTYVYICIQHRKRLSCVKSSQLSGSQHYDGMVQNPIYESDGPVYDSVQPEFNHKDMHAANTCIDIKHQGLELSTSPLKRYVDQPSIMHSGSFSFSLSKQEEAQCHSVASPAGRLSCSYLNGGWSEEELHKDTRDIN